MSVPEAELKKGLSFRVYGLLNLVPASVCNRLHAVTSVKMRLRTLLFDCPKPILDALEACNIDTVEEFLFSSSATALFQKLPPNIIPYAKLENLRDRVARLLAAEGRSGEEVLKELDGVYDKEGTHWKAGVSALDHLLQTVGHGIIEVAGGRGSGKTVHSLCSNSKCPYRSMDVMSFQGLVLALALNCLLESPDNVVHWIDTAGEFSAERASMLEKQLVLTDNVHQYVSQMTAWCYSHSA